MIKNKKKFHKIPIINISSLFNNSSIKKTNSVINQIHDAVKEYGFFIVTNHGIDLSLLNSIANLSNKFFALNNNIKLSLSPNRWNKSNTNIYRGYFPSSVNGKEGIDIGDPQITKSMIKLCNKLEKNTNIDHLIPMWSKIIDKYYEKNFNLGIILFKSILKNYNLNDKFFIQAFKRPYTLSTLRFNYYPKQEKPVEISKTDGVALGCETHVDSGIFTILYQDKKGGLQIQHRKLDTWLNVPYRKNSLIINTGLALEYLTGSHFKATNHRVLFNKSKRLSIPFFFEPSYYFQLDPSRLGIKMQSNFFKPTYDYFLNNSLKKFIEYQR